MMPGNWELPQGNAAERTAGSQQCGVMRPLRVTLIPVPKGSKIKPWHWWMDDVLNMTEAERAYYHGFPCSGERLKWPDTGTLFEVRIERPHNDQALRSVLEADVERKKNSGI